MKRLMKVAAFVAVASALSACLFPPHGGHGGQGGQGGQQQMQQPPQGQMQ